MTYEEIRKQRCEWCAKGDRPGVANRTVHKIYPMHASGGFKDPSITSSLSQYFRCTAPTPEQVIEAQGGEIERLKGLIDGMPHESTCTGWIGPCDCLKSKVDKS